MLDAKQIRYLTINSPEEVEAYIEVIRASAARAQGWLNSQTDDALGMMRKMKFELVGFHPVEERPLNLMEQINQTWTFLAALAGVRQLLRLHPEAGGFHLAPGAHASLDLDIMSVAQGYVGAETFAAVTPQNNGKLAADLKKLSSRSETHRYVLFISPAYPGLHRRPELEQGGIQVWSVDI